MALAVVTATALLGASSASAFTEFGNDCPGTPAASASNLTVYQAELAAGNPLPLTAPEAGVITAWRVNLAFPLVGLSEKLKVLRGGVGEASAVGESGVESLTGTQNIFKTRISVEPGDRLGLYIGESGFITCATTSGDVLGAYTGDLPVGSKGAPAGAAAGKLPVSAFLEPDADGDGYGDETQDRCPQDAAVHDACPLPPVPLPPLSLDAHALAQGNAILVFTGVSVKSSVTVAGNVRLPFKPKRKHKRGRQRAPRANLFAKLRGAGQAVAPGQVGQFRLPLPGPVKAQLQRTPPGRFLAAKLTVSARDEARQTTTKNIAVKLKGWQKKQKRRK